MLGRIAGFSVRHRRLVLAVWLIAVLGLALARQLAGGHFANDLSVPGTDSDRAYQVLHQRFPAQSGDALQVVVRTGGGVRTPAVRAGTAAALRRMDHVPGVAGVVSPYVPGGLVSADGTTAVAMVQFTQTAKDIPPASLQAVQDAAGPIRHTGAQVEFGGPALQTQEHPNGGEVAGLAAAVLVLLFAFGSVFAMLVPLVTALLALGLGLSAVGLLSAVTPIGTAGPVVAAMVGLGVGIDYALLIVTRHREAMAAGQPAARSIPHALSTAGRSVLVAGSTVVVAILALYLIGVPFVATLGLATAVTVTVTLLAAVTLLPALLGLFGGRLDRYRVRRIRFDHRAARPDGRAPGWHRWIRRVQRRPVRYLLAATAVLVLLGVPFLSMRLGTADAGSSPTTDTSRRAYDIVAAEFGPGYTGPLILTSEYPAGVSAAAVHAQAQQLRQALAATPGVAAVSPPRFSPAGGTAVLSVVPAGAPQDATTTRLVHTLRDRTIPRATAGQQVQVHVGGETAMSIDLADRLSARLPWFIGAVVAVSVLLLMAEFRSLVLPVKAALVNLLSVGAAYGAVVAAFQWGWLPGIQPGPVESFAPVMLFAVLFGLTMDYEVFLLSRVREEYLATGDPAGSVAGGIAATARVITAAASVMVVVFASFMLNDQRVVNLFGFGLAVAFAIDATVVRVLRVPAVMTLAGHRAWWLPRGAGRILPRIGPGPAATPVPGPGERGAGPAPTLAGRSRP